MKVIVVVFISLFMIVSSVYSQLETGEKVAVASTKNGKVRGFIHNRIYTYKGIPYGMAKRFEAAQKPEAWEGVRSSMTYGPVAPLIDPTVSVMDEVEFVFNHDWGYSSEDCMVLNVWTPSIDDVKKRPVMFWIHGGGYTAGSSQELPSYDGESLAKTGDVVVVSINHRLNMLGFMDLSAYGEKYKYSANNSIRDIRLALEWVRDNIANFGGDPNNVTIFGQSGGGAKVNNLMSMPSAKGLFHKAINQSGSFRMNMLEKEETRLISEEVLKILEIAPENVDQLQEVPFSELAAAGKQALKKVEDKMKTEGKTIPGFGLNWGPSVDGDLFPYQMFSDEAFELSKDVPLLIGTVKNEFMMSGRMGLTNATDEQALAFFQQQFGDKAEAYVNAAKKAYPDHQKPAELLDIDMMFRPGAIYQANEKSSLKGGAPVYTYVFTWQSPVVDGKYKAMHCMELPFVFNNIARCEEMTGGNEDAYELAEKVSQAWINFARSGDPNHNGIPEWKLYTREDGATMLLDNKIKLVFHHDKELMELMQ